MSVTQLVPNFLGGVSQQADVKKKTGQVRDAVNAYVEPTFGLIKRPGFQFLKTLATKNSIGPSATDLDNAYWFFYLRDSDEAYFGAITKGTPGSIYMWNSITLAPCTVTFDGDSQNYLEGTTPHSDYDVLTIQDTSIITNKNKDTELKSVTLSDKVLPRSRGTIQLLKVEYSAEYVVKINDQEFTLTTRNGDDVTDPTATTKKLNADEILSQLKTGIEGLGQGITVTQLNVSLELK